MVWHRLLADLSPIIDRASEILCCFKLAAKAIDKTQIVNHISGEIPRRVGEEVIGDYPFVGEDHEDSGGEALVPGVLGHELDEITWRRT